MDVDVAVIGAGPYGLAVASRLGPSGVDVRVFGTPMAFWAEHMPRGMLLRSPVVASSIGDPAGPLGIEAYHRACDLPLQAPVPLERFIDYGRWVQHQAVPTLDRRHVAAVERVADGFDLMLADGDRCAARRVVVAAGIAHFAHRPPPFAGAPRELVSHTSEHRDLARFAGRRVIVIGGGQSALETAALLAEAGADVELIVRRPGVTWLGRHGWTHRLGPATRVLHAPHEVGPPLLSQLVGLPGAFSRVPRPLQDRLHVLAIRPAGAAWLRGRVEGHVVTSAGRSVREVGTRGDGVELALDDGSRRTADHVVLGTGYRVDIGRYPFLPAELLRHVDRVAGSPVLGPAFESSVAGLHFLGAPAARSYGPLLRFVAGSHFAASRLERALSGQRRTAVAAR